MTRSISRAEVLDAPLIISNGLSVSSVTHVLLVGVFMSLFLLVYVNFSNRVNTTRLNQLLTDQERPNAVRAREITNVSPHRAARDKDTWLSSCKKSESCYHQDLIDQDKVSRYAAWAENQILVFG
jgi:hypothetical protein